MDDTRDKALSEIKKLNKKKGIVAPWQMPPLKGISFKLARDKADEKLISRLQNECDNPKYYHLIKLTGIHSYDRLYILKSTLDFVYPSELIPCHYFQCATEVRFLARRCKEALLKIVDNNFLIPHYPANSSLVGIGTTFEAAIVANYCEASIVEIDRSENILQVLKSRFQKETGTLDLSNFVADKGLEEYCPLFQPRMLLFVMFLSTELENVKTINLKDNNIKHITCMDVLKDSQLETVDLTYNQIKHIEDIKDIADAPCIKNLKLEHNPLCSNYENYNYVIDVKTLLPNLKTLDGIDVTTPLFKKNFVCSPDTQDLAQQFMTHFFTIYDSNDREDLKDLYEDDAYFSVNVRVIPFQKNSCLVRLSHYGLKHPFTVQSREEIMKLFKSFPRTQHDTYTFVCDLLIFTPRYAVLTIGGIFKELNQILGFSRTFVLRYNKGSYTIANDQMTVYNATDYQLGWSFSFPLRVEYFGHPLPYYPEQYEAVGELTQKLSKMNLEYCKMLLDYCDYDVNKAVYLFSELYKNDVLPAKAFQKQEGQQNDGDKKKTDLPFFSSIMEKSLEDPSQASTKSVWNAFNTNRLQKCEDRVPNCPTNIIKIQRSTKPNSLDQYSLELSCDEDGESNVAASSTSYITNQIGPPTLNCINSNATLICDTSSDPPIVILPNLQASLFPVTLCSKISVRSDLFSSQASDPYGISQRIQEIVNKKANTSPLSNLNHPCSISERTGEIIVPKSRISDIYSPIFDNQKIIQTVPQTESRNTLPSLSVPKHNENTSNNSNVTLAEPCAYITIDEDDDDDNLPIICNDVDKVIEASAPTNEVNVGSNGSTSSTLGEELTYSTGSISKQPASTSRSSSQANSGSQLIEEIIKKKEKAAVYADKFQESGSSRFIESVDKSSDTMSQGEIDKLYKKVNKNSFPWLDRNHTRRFKYLLQKNLVSRKLCDVVTDGLKRKQMCELLDEELTPTRLETLYRDGYLGKDPMFLIGGSLSVNAATYLSRVQKERLQWFLNKELISRNYHKYFSPVHIKAMTSQFLSTDRLKSLYEQGYLMKDPRLVTKDNQEASCTQELRDEDDSVVFPDFRDFHLNKRGRFFQKLFRYLTLNRSDRALYTCGAKYLKEYIPYRQEDVKLAAQYAVHIGVPRSKVLDILDHELLFQRTSELERALSRSRRSTKKRGHIDSTTRKRSINRDHDQPSCKKPKLREKSSSSSSTPIDTIVLEDDDEPSASETSLTQKVNHTFTDEELIVVKKLENNQKRRLQWLLDHNLLGKKYFKYLKPENFSFITKESLTMQRLWILFTKEWLIRDPAFLFDKKGKQNVAVQRTNFSSGIYSKGSMISHSKYCQELYNYLDMNPESRANNVSGIRDYLVEYTPYRFNEVICTVKYALANKHRWNKISAILLKDGLIHDIADLETKVFGFVQPISESAATNAPESATANALESAAGNASEFTPSVTKANQLEYTKYYSFVEIEDVGSEECSFDPSLYIKPYFVKPRKRRLTQNKMQLIPYIVHPVFTNKCTVSTLFNKRRLLQRSYKNKKPSNTQIEYKITTVSESDEQIIHEKCRHLNETQKDRIRWLLYHNLLGKKCYTYFKPSNWKYLAAKTISMFRLWHLYGSKKIIRDPGYLFEKNIPLAKQKALVHVQECTDAVDQYCLHGIRDQFFKKLRRYLMGVQADKVRNYMLDYAPYRYNDIVAAVKSMSLTLADFPLSEISAVLEQGQLIKNAQRFEHDVNELQTETKLCNICTITDCDETSAMENDSKKIKRLLTGLELEEISDEESSILTTNAPVRPIITGVDLEEISDEESSVLLREVTNTSHNETKNINEIGIHQLPLPAGQETDVVIISDDEETVPTNWNNSITNDAVSDSVKDNRVHVLSNIFEIRKRKRKREIAKKRRKDYMQLPVTTVSTTNKSPAELDENHSVTISESEVDKFFHLSKDEKLNWLVDNGFLSKDYKSYFRNMTNLLSDCDTSFKLWNYFKEGLLIKDPTATYASERDTAHFYKKAKNRLVEVNGNYVYERNMNTFIQKLGTFVRSKLQHENYMKCKHVQPYLLEYIPYRRYEVLAFVKYALSEFDWTGVSFALAHIMLAKDLSQLEIDVYEFLKNESNDGNASLGVPGASVRTCSDTPVIGNVEKIIDGNVNEDDSVIIAKSEIVKFFHLGSKYKKFKWLIDNRFLSKNYIRYFPFDKIQWLLDCDSLFKMWSFFKEGLLIRDPTLIYASEQHDYFNKKAERKLDKVDGNYIYKNEINIFIQKLHTFVCSKLQPECSASGMAHLKDYLVEYIPYRHYEVTSFLRHALSAFKWTEISTLLADIMHEKYLSQLKTDVYRIKKPQIIDDKELSLSHNTWSKPNHQNESLIQSQQNNMQLVPYLGKPRMCESIFTDAQTINDSYSLEKIDFIHRLSALRQDRLRWLLHQNLINKHFYIHIPLKGIKKLASETFNMYTLWFHFYSGLLIINPSFLFESSFTSEQQQAMTLNLVRKNSLQQISGHYVLKQNRFRSNLSIFLTQEINKTFKPAKHARRKAYLLEFIPSRHYETVAELHNLSGKYPSKRLKELLEKELGVHDIVELDTSVGVSEQVEDLGTDTSFEILNKSVESVCTISHEESCSQITDILKSCGIVSIFQNDEGDGNIEVANDMQIVPYLPRPWEVSNQNNLFDDSCEKHNGLTGQVDFETVEFDTIEDDEIAVLRYLNEVQRDRLRWLLENDLLSKLYYKYFSLNQLRTITYNALTWETLWKFFGFGYLKRDPHFLFETSRSLNLQPPNVASKDTPSGYRRGTLFRRKFHAFLRAALSDRGIKNDIVRNYVSEYANHRYEELVKLLRYWSVEDSWSKLSPILKNTLSIHNIEELERRVFGSAVIDDIGDEEEGLYLTYTVDKPRLHSKLQNDVGIGTKQVYDMQIVPYLLNPWKKPEQKQLFVESNDNPKKPRALKTVTSEIGTMEKQEIEVLRCLNAVQRDRLQWLVDNKLLCESYYDYFSLSELKFISNDALCLSKLWHMFFDGYLIQNPEVLFGNKISFQLKKGFDIQYKFYKTNAHVDSTDSDRIFKEVKTLLMCPQLQSNKAAKRVRNRRDWIYDRGLYPRTTRNSSIHFAAKTLFGQKFISYIVLYIKAIQSDTDILSRLRNYLLDYLPFRLDNVTIILKHIVKKYPWRTVKTIFEQTLPVYDISCLENRMSKWPKKNITDFVNVLPSLQGLKRKITNCTHVVPYAPPSWKITENYIQVLKQNQTGFACAENNEFHLDSEAVIHLTVLEKDRLRWLLTKKFLNVSCYSYFSADQLKSITKNPLTLYILWFLFEYGYITRDPGFLFESDIPVERQRELACKLYDKYTTNQFRCKFGTYLGLSIKSEQTSNIALINHRNYVLEYVPYRYDATISYLKQYRVFTKHPWKKISSILKKDGIIQNLSDFEFSVFGSKQSCGKQIIDAAVHKQVERPFSNASLDEATISEPKFTDDAEATIDKDLHESPGSKLSEYLIKQKEKSRRGRKKVTEENARKKKMHKYLESLKRRMRMTTVRTSVLVDSPLPEESNEEDDVFEEFKALDSSCCTAEVSPKIERRQTYVSSLETLKTAMHDQLAKETCYGLLSARNTPISKRVDTVDIINSIGEVTKHKVEGRCIGEIVISDSAPTTETESLNDELIDTVGGGAYNLNKTDKNTHFKGNTDVSTRISMDTKSECSKSAVKKSKTNKAIKRSILDVAGSYCENIDNTAAPTMGKLKPGMESVSRLKDTDTDGSTDRTTVTTSTAIMNSPIEALKKTKKTVVSMVKIEDSDSKEFINLPIKQRSSTSKHRRKTEIKSTNRIEDADTDINTDNTEIVDVEDSESEEIGNTQIEKISEGRRKMKVKSMNKVENIDSEKNIFSIINSAKMSSQVEAVNKSKRKIPMVKVDDSDSEEIMNASNEKRSGMSEGRRKRKIKSVSTIYDIDTDGSTDNIVIVNVEDSDSEKISSTRTGKRSEGGRKTKMKSVSRFEDTDTNVSAGNTVSAISTVKISSYIETDNKFKRMETISLGFEVEGDNYKNNSITPVDKKSTGSKGRRKTKMKSLSRMEHTDTDGSTDNNITTRTISRAKISSPVEAVNTFERRKSSMSVRIENSDSKEIIDTPNEKRSSIFKGKRKTRIKSVSKDRNSYSKEISVANRAYTRRGSSSEAMKGFKKVEKILVVKIENAEKMIRTALSAKRAANRKSKRMQDLRGMEKSSVKETPTINIEDTDSEEFIVDVRTPTRRRNGKSSTSKVTTISSDSTEGTAEIIKEVESFLQGSDMNVRKYKERLDKRGRKLNISSLEPTKSGDSDEVTPIVSETVVDTVSENRDAPEQKTYTLRVKSLDELTGRVSEKRPFDEVQDQSDVVSSTKKVRMDDDYLTGISALEMSDEVVMINGEVISFK